MKKVLIGIAVFIAAIFGLNKLMEIQERYDCPDKVITVGPGDTLSGITGANCTGNIQRATDDLAEEYGHVIRLGQKIQLP